MMYLIIVLGIYHLLKTVLKKENTLEEIPTTRELREDSRHPAEVQLR